MSMPDDAARIRETLGPRAGRAYEARVDLHQTTLPAAARGEVVPDV